MNYRVNTPVVAGGIVAAALVLGAVGLATGGDGRSQILGRDGLTAGGSPTTQLAGRPPPGPARPDLDYDLAGLLVPGVGAGFTPADPARFPQGSLDVAAAARREPEPAVEREVLEYHGFQRGYERTWTGPEGDVIGAVLYQFGEQAGAEGYLADGVAAVLDQGATEFPLPFPGGHGFTLTDGSTTVQTVAFVRRTYFFLFVLGSDRGALTAEQAQVIAADQLRRLGGLS